MMRTVFPRNDGAGSAANAEIVKKTKPSISNSVPRKPPTRSATRCALRRFDLPTRGRWDSHWRFLNNMGQHVVSLLPNIQKGSSLVDSRSRGEEHSDSGRRCDPEQ